MIPLTTTDANAGYLIIGVVVGLVGAGLIWFGRSAYAERQVAKAERIMGLDSQPTTHQFAHELTTGEDEYHDRDAIARTVGMRDSLAEARHIRDALNRLDRAVPPRRRLASVPVQGKPSGWS